MRHVAILDTGPLVALLNRDDEHHAWSESQWGELATPVITCESVITEAFYLVRRFTEGRAGVIEMLRRNDIQIRFQISDHLEPISQLLRKYADVPMSLADACLVRMAEIFPGAKVFTLDSDFRLYRSSNRRVIPLLAPPRR